MTTEDAYGTPPAARGSMMKVAGASDADPGEDHKGESELITDNDPTTLPSPVYKTTMGEIRRLVHRLLRND